MALDPTEVTILNLARHLHDSLNTLPSGVSEAGWTGHRTHAWTYVHDLTRSRDCDRHPAFDCCQCWASACQLLEIVRGSLDADRERRDVLVKVHDAAAREIAGPFKFTGPIELGPGSVVTISTTITTSRS